MAKALGLVNGFKDPLRRNDCVPLFTSAVRELFNPVETKEYDHVHGQAVRPYVLIVLQAIQVLGAQPEKVLNHGSRKIAFNDNLLDSIEAQPHEAAEALLEENGQRIPERNTVAHHSVQEFVTDVSSQLAGIRIAHDNPLGG